MMYLMEHPGEAARMENRNQEEALEHLHLAKLRPGDNVLDVGCAAGWLTRLIARQVAPGQAVGVDVSEERISAAKSLASQQGVDVDFVQGDAYTLPFESGHFDVVVSRYLFEYLTEPARALAEFKRVTRPGGRVIVADLDGNGLLHYPIPADLERTLQKLSTALGPLGFDPYIGRKLYHLFFLNGFRRIEVSILPHHVVAGSAPEGELQNWQAKLETIRPFARAAFGGDEEYQHFMERCLELLRRPDVLSYSVTFIVAGVV